MKRTFWPDLPDDKDERLTWTPNIGRERQLEAIVQQIEWLEEMIEDAPSLKCDTEPLRRPKVKRVKPPTSPVLSREARAA